MDGKHDFLSSEDIAIETPKSSIFIQTDKPIYKPGQTGMCAKYIAIDAVCIPTAKIL